MAEVLLKNVTKTFGTVFAVDNVNINVNDGEFFVLLGPSGCGKTTTLRIIAGLEEVTSGEVYIGEKLVNDIPPKDRDIAMVFQNYALYPHMNVYKNISFGLELRKIPKDEIDKKVKEVASMLGLEGLLMRKPKELSGGQRQRVALARAIVRDPKVYLMDEPLSNLDAKLRVQTRGELIKLHERLGVTTIYVTHDQVEAMTLGDRVVVMNQGKVQQIGTPKEVFDHPANRFVAGFVGTPPMNFFDVTLEREGDKFILRGTDFSLPLLKEHGKILENNNLNSKEVVLGVRPKDIFPREELIDSMKDIVEKVQAPVDFVELLGSETYLHFSLNGAAAVARASANANYNIGDMAELYVDLRNIHVFDKETGQAYF